MAPDSTKSPKKSSSGSKSAKKPVSIMESLLSSAFHKDESSSSKSSKRPAGKDSKERNKPESKSTPSGSKHGTESTKTSHHKPSVSKTSKLSHVPSEKFLKSEFFRDESQTPEFFPPSQASRPPQSPHPPTSKLDSQPPLGSTQDQQPSKAPPTKLKSVHVTEKDKKMATRQLKIEKLSDKDLEEQEAWALEKLIESGRCPQNWGWGRYTAPAGYEKYNGYRCCGSSQPGARHVHMISHELLAEGKGGLYILSFLTNWWDGPFYPGDHENAFAFQSTPFAQTFTVQQIASQQQQ